MNSPILWEPKVRCQPVHILPDVASAWKGIELILPDLFREFHVKHNLAVEFGVEHGFSTVALSNHFSRVIGVDTFLGDSNTGTHESWYGETSKNLRQYSNIELVQASWQDWCSRHEGHCDLIHIDIEHTYEQTFGCGMWSVSHAPVVIFHDTEEFSEVRRAVEDIAERSRRRFFNFREHHGLGILA